MRDGMPSSFRPSLMYVQTSGAVARLVWYATGPAMQSICTTCVWSGRDSSAPHSTDLAIDGLSRSALS